MGCFDSKQQRIKKENEQFDKYMMEQHNQRYKDLDGFFMNDYQNLNSFSQLPEEIVTDCFPEFSSKQQFLDSYSTVLSEEDKHNLLFNISQKYQKIRSANMKYNENEDQVIPYQNEEQILQEKDLRPVKNLKSFNFKSTKFDTQEVVVRYNFMNKIGNYNYQTGKYKSTDQKQTAYIKKGVIKDKSFKTMGKVGITGVVRDAHNKQIGSISSLGVVRNAKGQVIGRSKGNDKSVAAFTHFFSNASQGKGKNTSTSSSSKKPTSSISNKTSSGRSSSKPSKSNSRSTGGGRRR